MYVNLEVLLEILEYQTISLRIVSVSVMQYYVPHDVCNFNKGSRYSEIFG